MRVCNALQQLQRGLLSKKSWTEVILRAPLLARASWCDANEPKSKARQRLGLWTAFTATAHNQAEA